MLNFSRLFLILLFSWQCCNFQAQQIQIASGINFSSPANSSGDLIFQGDSTSFFLLNNALTLKKGELFLYKFNNSSCKKIFEKEIWFNHTGTLTIVNATYYNNKVNLFVQVNSPDNKVYLMKHEFLPNTGVEIPAGIEVDRFDAIFETAAIIIRFVIYLSAKASIKA